MSPRRCCPSVDRSGFAGFRFPPDVIAVAVAVRWSLRFGLSYRDTEELLAKRGIVVDHVTIYRWVQRFTPMFIDAARPCRHAVGDRWFVDGHCCLESLGPPSGRLARCPSATSARQLIGQSLSGSGSRPM